MSGFDRTALLLTALLLASCATQSEHKLALADTDAQGSAIGGRARIATAPFDGPIPALPSPRHGHRMENCNGTLVVAGGFDFYSDEPSRGSLSTLLLKPGATEWVEGPRMAEAKSFYSSVEIDGCMYALGPRIERFDPVMGKWQVVMRDDSLQRSHFAAAMANGRVLMIGRQVHEYDPVAGTCTLVEAWPGIFSGLAY